MRRRNHPKEEKNNKHMPRHERWGQAWTGQQHIYNTCGLGMPRPGIITLFLVAQSKPGTPFLLWFERTKPQFDQSLTSSANSIGPQKQKWSAELRADFEDRIAWRRRHFFFIYPIPFDILELEWRPRRRRPRREEILMMAMTFSRLVFQDISA
jgi:hypothetical protein